MAMSDILELCRIFNVNPIFAAKAEVSPTELDSEDDIEKFTKQVKAVSCDRTYRCDGEKADTLLLSYTEEEFTKLFGVDESTVVKWNKTQVRIVTIMSEMTQACQPTSLTELMKCYTKSDKLKLHRKIKHFSGNEKPASGECSVTDWLVLAQDLVDHARDMKVQDKIDYLRNTLVGNALQLINSTTSEIDSPQDVIDLIARTYGGSVSSDQLYFEYHLITQSSKEKPSCLWTKLQTKLLQIEKVGKIKTTMDSERFNQFVWGLCPTDHDILSRILDFEQITANKKFPAYANFLKELQCIERERLERSSRSTKSKVHSGLIVAEEYSEVEQLKSEIQSLRVRVETAQADTPVVASVRTNPKYQKQDKKKFYPKKKFHKPKSTTFRGTCWNCQQQGHRLPDCTREFDQESVRKRFAEHKSKLSTSTSSSTLSSPNNISEN